MIRNNINSLADWQDWPQGEALEFSVDVATDEEGVSKYGVRKVTFNVICDGGVFYAQPEGGDKLCLGGGVGPLEFVFTTDRTVLVTHDCGTAAVRRLDVEGVSGWSSDPSFVQIDQQGPNSDLERVVMSMQRNMLKLQADLAAARAARDNG